MPDRFAKVQDGLYRGGKPTPKEVSMLKDLWGIKKIVSLDQKSGDEIAPIAKKLGIEHVIWGIGRGNDPKVAALKKRIVPSLLHGGPTYVHCVHGKDRTGMTIAMFRIYSGWSLEDALKEAQKFGMGRDLRKDTKDSYYDAVRNFAKDFQDENDSEDAVTIMRENNSMAPLGTGLDDSTISRTDRSSLPPHADIESGNSLSRVIASFGNSKVRIYCKCNSSKVLSPKKFWYGSKKEALNNPADESGKLFSASFSTDTTFKNFDGQVTDKLVHQVLLSDIDVGILRGDKYLVLVPYCLVNIHEEDDINELDMPEVGTVDRSTSGAFYSFPGSGSGVGGMPPSGSGFVELPYSGPSAL